MTPGVAEGRSNLSRIIWRPAFERDPPDIWPYLHVLGFHSSPPNILIWLCKCMYIDIWICVFSLCMLYWYTCIDRERFLKGILHMVFPLFMSSLQSISEQYNWNQSLHVCGSKTWSFHSTIFTPKKHLRKSTCNTRIEVCFRFSFGDFSGEPAVHFASVYTSKTLELCHFVRCQGHPNGKGCLVLPGSWDGWAGLWWGGLWI